MENIKEFIKKGSIKEINTKRGFFGTYFVNTDTGSRLLRRNVYYANNERDNIRQALIDGKFDILATIKPVVSSNIMLTSYVAKDKSIALTQLFEFELSSEIHPLTDPIVLRNDAVKSLAK